MVITQTVHCTLSLWLLKSSSNNRACALIHKQRRYPNYWQCSPRSPSKGLCLRHTRVWRESYKSAECKVYVKSSKNIGSTTTWLATDAAMRGREPGYKAPVPVTWVTGMRHLYPRNTYLIDQCSGGRQLCDPHTSRQLIKKTSYTAAISYQPALAASTMLTVSLLLSRARVGRSARQVPILSVIDHHKNEAMLKC